jgi:hypothetical protein
MNDWLGYELSKLHGQDLAREAEIDRLARLARSERPRRLRRRLGRTLVHLGLNVAGVCSAESLEPRRA